MSVIAIFLIRYNDDVNVYILSIDLLRSPFEFVKHFPQFHDLYLFIVTKIDGN